MQTALIECPVIQYTGDTDELHEFFNNSAHIQNTILKFYQDGQEHSVTIGNYIIKFQTRYYVILDNSIIKSIKKNGIEQ